METSVVASEVDKRVVIITGDKGGVGKSTFARGLLQLYINRGLNCLAYDSDKSNSQLYRHYNSAGSGVNLIDIFTRGGADDLMIDLDSKRPRLALVDLPAQARTFFEDFEKDLGVFDAVKSLGYQITMVSVVSRVKDSVNVLRLLFDYCGHQTNYVVVKNLFHTAGDETKFECYDDSETRKSVLESGGVEILMPDLFYKAYDFIDRKNMSFGEVLTTNDPEVNIAIRSRIAAWMKTFEENALLASALLGLETNAGTQAA